MSDYDYREIVIYIPKVNKICIIRAFYGWDEFGVEIIVDYECVENSERVITQTHPNREIDEVVEFLKREEGAVVLDTWDRRKW